jgi:hypothetical protein
MVTVARIGTWRWGDHAVAAAGASNPAPTWHRPAFAIV